jgi:hypothetical protein
VNKTYADYDTIELPFDSNPLYDYHVHLSDELKAYPDQSIGYVTYRCETDSKMTETQTKLRPL